MTRLSGIALLALSIALWALAVWLFDAPSPNGAETGAASATSATTPTPGTDAGGPSRVETATASGPAASVTGGAGAPAGERPVVSTPPPSAASRETVSAAADDASRIALAPASGGGADATVGRPAAARASAGSGPEGVDAGSGRARASAGSGPEGADAGGPPVSPRPGPSFYSAMPFPPPPVPGDGTATHDGAVAGAINAARRAAWEGQLAAAVAHYRAAARLRPDDYRVWGEMGNVLWAMHRWPEAAYALEGAATLLIRAGELRAASELAQAVKSIDMEAAHRVERLLWSAAQRQSG